MKTTKKKTACCCRVCQCAKSVQIITPPSAFFVEAKVSLSKNKYPYYQMPQSPLIFLHFETTKNGLNWIGTISKTYCTIIYSSVTPYRCCLRGFFLCFWVRKHAFKQNDVEQGACKYRPDMITIDRIYKWAVGLYVFESLPTDITIIDF